MKKIREEDVDFDENDVALYEGIPFTGEAIEFNPSGVKVSLTTYKDGHEDGPSLEWYPNGMLFVEGMVSRGGRAVGMWKKWHPNGQIALEQKFGESGGLLFEYRWDEDGNLVKNVNYEV